MLSLFTTRHTFGLCRATLYVDCDKQSASMDVARARRLVVVNHAVPFHEVRTPELAERYMSAPVSDWREAGAVIGRMEGIALNVSRYAEVTRTATPDPLQAFVGLERVRGAIAA